MLNVCAECGEYRADKIIDPTGPAAICPLCQHPHPFRQLPLVAISGPSGAGKSTVCNALVQTTTTAVVLDADILWREDFNQPANHYAAFFDTWLRMAKNISQAGRPVVLFNAGAVPANLEPCIERRYFSRVRYLALVCQDDVLRARLNARPTWRGSHDSAFIEEQITFCRFLVANPAIECIDTSADTAVMTVAKVAAWLAMALQSSTDGPAATDT